MRALGCHGDGIGVSTGTDTNLLHVWDNADGPGQYGSGKNFCLSSFPVSFLLLNMVISKLSEWMLKSSGISAYGKVCRKTNPTNDVAPRVFPRAEWGHGEWGRDPTSCAAEGVWHLCHCGEVLPVPTGVTCCPRSVWSRCCDSGEGLTPVLQLQKSPVNSWVRDVWGIGEGLEPREVAAPWAMGEWLLPPQCHCHSPARDSPAPAL